jgi:soluble lytic murein transglycosylase-like protein
LIAFLAFAWAMLAGMASAQVFEVTDAGMRRVDSASASPPAPRPGADRQGTEHMAIPAAVQAAALRHGLAPELLDSVARRESAYRIAAVSPAGALGVMQLMPRTAKSLGVDPRDPAQNIEGGAAYLRSLLDRFDGRIDLALAAYNAGPGAVQRHAGVPPYRQTRDYLAANLDGLARRSLAQASVAPLSPTNLKDAP